MAKSILSVKNTSFSYLNQEKALINNLTTSFPVGWTAVVGPNGSGKSTLLSILSGRIRADEGEVILPGSVLQVDQVCRQAPDSLMELFARSDKEALKLISLLGLQYDWPYRWDTLSQGEKKRSQLAAAIGANPAALLLDEPINHLDKESKEMAIEAMETYEGCGILVSHSRVLLDRFCNRTLFLPEGKVYKGNFSRAREEREKKELDRKREYDKARHEMKKLEKEAARRRALAATQNSRRSKKHLKWKDSDGRAKLDLVRITGKDGTDGRLLRQLDGRLAQASNRLEESHWRKDADLGITFHSQVSHSDFIWRKENGTVPYNGVSGRGVQWNELFLKPGDRVLLTGFNGAGKTTLLNSIYRELGHQVWLLEQEFANEDLLRVRHLYESLEKEEKGRVLSSMTRMGAESDDFLSIHQWSPGEIKKLHIAISLERDIPFKTAILLDEPVNHLDMECRELLEEALETFPGAILMISHDEKFLRKTITARWHLETTEQGSLCRTY